MDGAIAAALLMFGDAGKPDLVSSHVEGNTYLLIFIAHQFTKLLPEFLQEPQELLIASGVLDENSED